MAQENSEIRNNMEAGKGIVDQTMDKARNAASQVSSQAQEWASAAGEKTKDGIDQVTRKATEGYNASKNFLQEQNMGEVGDKMMGMVNKYPLQSLLVGIGVGVLLGRSMTSSK